MSTQSEDDVLKCFRDAKVEGRAIPIRDHVPFQENYIEMLMWSLEKQGLLEWDDTRDCLVISKAGLEHINRSRPYKPLEDNRPLERKPPKIRKY